MNRSRPASQHRQADLGAEAGADVFARLRAFRTPTIYDAIERFGVRPKSDGYTNGSVRCVLPQLGAFVGYAWTGKIIGERPALPGEPSISWRAVWEHARDSRLPAIAVVEDIDAIPGKACAWGDVSATIFKTLGFGAAITNGSVRDIPEIEAIGFGLFAGAASVGHGNVRFIEVGAPVTVGGLPVHPDDLIHADLHGVTVIPAEIDLEELIRSADHVLKAEEKVKRYCQSAAFDIAELDDLHTWSMETST
jgi:regulator of RNase E activity RraA